MLFHEDEKTELKRILNDAFEKEVDAFLNTLGGQILIGIEDNGAVCGVENADQVALSIADRIRNNILPSAMGLFTVEIRQEEMRSYLVVTVAGGLERPYYLKKHGMTPNGCYTRIGTQASPMTQNMIDGFFSRRILNTLHNVVSPNQELTFTQLKIYYQEKGYDAAGSYFLKNLDLFTEDGKYNYAAYLMADHNGTSIKVARFRGTEKLDIVERNEFGRCCLIKSALNVLERLNVANTTVVRVGGKAQRKEIRLIDPAALREAVLNAIIHNDYINGAYPVFEIYDDRIEIISSGGLPVGLSEKEFFAGRSLPRNKELMRIFSDMDLCEQLGSGMKKILRIYPQSVFSVSEHFIDVRFDYAEEAMEILREQNQADNQKPNVSDDRINDRINVIINGKITEIERNIMELISEQPNATTDMFCQKTGKTARTVSRALKSLQEKGYLKRIGSRKSGVWEICSDEIK